MIFKFLFREIVINNASTLRYQFSPKETYFKNLKPITMKKIIYILLFAFATSMSFTACTEEEVTPSTELNGGGSEVDPK